jgi:hypothetical protein
MQVYNFSAGPAILPLEVLQEAQRDTLNYGGSGMSVMEMSHRSKAFEGIIKAAEADLRALLSIPDNYKVLFVQGGASTQFAAIPLNFTQEGAWRGVAWRGVLRAELCVLSCRVMSEGGGCGGSSRRACVGDPQHTAAHAPCLPTNCPQATPLTTWSLARGAKRRTRRQVR